MPRKRDIPPEIPPLDEDMGVIDELQAWYLGLADRDHWVYTMVLRQLVGKLYRDRDYLARRQKEEKRTAYDWAVERDMRAIAWAIRELVKWLPDEEKEKPEPPKPARKPSRRLPENASPGQKRMIHRQAPRGWHGPEMPPEETPE
jgi:hypothetical protein